MLEHRLTVIDLAVGQGPERRYWRKRWPLGRLPFAVEGQPSLCVFLAIPKQVHHAVV